MKNLIKLAVSASLCGLLGTAISPVLSVKADENSAIVTNTSSSDEDFNSMYSKLTAEKKQEFNQLVADGNFSKSEQLEILQSKISNDNSDRLRGIKLTVVKKIALYVAKYTGRSIASKPLKSFVNYLTNFEGKSETGIRNGLIKYLHFSKTAAYWTARTIVFIYL
ncbi:hypothetical protein [Liquorilactobacillus cacaonum]|nr:hypothetical protein [Liquorilactobacillus cacaonum]